MAHDVFISYSHKDKPIADAICSNIENAGVRCWIAPRDITPGLDWPTAISSAIATSRMMVLVFSANSNSSIDVSREIILAANNNLIIIPFKIDNIAPEPGKQYYLARTHWLDAMNPPTQEQIEKLVQHVKSFMLDEEPNVSPKPSIKVKVTSSKSAVKETGRVQKNAKRKSIWIWGSLILLVLIGGTVGTIYFLKQKTASGLSIPTLAAPVTITVWHQYSASQLPFVEEVFNAYMLEHPNVTVHLSMKGVTVIVDGDYSARITDLLNASIPSGQGPDFIIWDGSSVIPNNAPSGNIVSLDEYGVTLNWLLSVYEPVKANSMISNNRIWGLPVDQSGLAIIYNKSLASESDFPEDPLDFIWLRDNMEQYYATNDIPLLCFELFSAFHVAPLFFGFGLPAYVDEQGAVYLNTPQAVNALNWLVSIKPFTLQDIENDTCWEALQEGRVAAMWGGPWWLDELESAGIQYGIIPMGTPFVGGNTVILTKNAVDRGLAEIALDIMIYYTSAEVQKNIALQIYNANPDSPAFYVTANTAALEDSEIQANPITAGFTASFRLGVPVSNSPYTVAQWNPIREALLNAWNGSQTPDEALTAAQAALEAEIAGMKK